MNGSLKVPEVTAGSWGLFRSQEMLEEPGQGTDMLREEGTNRVRCRQRPPEAVAVERKGHAMVGMREQGRVRGKDGPCFSAEQTDGRVECCFPRL